MRKSWLVVSLIVLVMVAVALVGCKEKAPAPAPKAAPAPQAAPAAIELKLSNFVPQVTAFATYFIEPWGYTLERATKGKVKVVNFHGGALAGPKDAYEAAAKGIADISWTTATYEAGRFPKLEVFNLPFMCGYWGRHTSMACWRMYPKYFADEFKDVKLLWIYCTQANSLYTSKKQVKTIDDLKGMKIGVHPLAVKALEALGAAPVSMTVSEFYEALNRGIVDGVFSDDQMVQAFRLHEVAKYCTVISLYCNPCPWVMNLKSYNNLPDDVRRVLDGMSGTLGMHCNGIQAEFAMLRSKAFLEKQGMQYYTLPESERGKAISKVRLIIDNWVSGMEAKGLPGRELVDEARKWLEVYKYVEAEYWY
jgi:TRAP-type C4-dicarboxylate transport system substrate-binding protein